MKSRIILLLITCVLFSCSKKDKYYDAQVFGFDDFKNEIKLEGRVLEFDDLILRPTSVLVFDSILITLGYDGEKFCNVYNLNTGKKVGERIMKGQGPNEMIMPQFIDNDRKSVQFVDMATSIIYQYALDDFIHNPDPQPISKAKLEENISSVMQMLGKDVIGYSYFKEHQLYAFNMSGNKTNEFADFPPSSISYSNIEKTDAFYMGFTSNLVDKIAICYYMTDLIEIYNSTGTLLKRIHGPEHFFSYFTEVQNGGDISSIPVKGKNRDSYFSPKNGGDHIFVLYNGGYVDEKGHSSSCKKLFSFSWEGVPENIYLLNDPIFTFCVDEKQKKIYGISDVPEFHIVEYKY